MPARGRKPSKTRRAQPKPKMVRLGFGPQLTRSEIRQLREKAAADMRSIGNYVGFLVIQDLRDQRRSAGSSGRAPSPSDRRAAYAIRIMLTVDQKALLEAKANDQVRSVSSYVAKLIVEDLAAGVIWIVKPWRWHCTFRIQRGSRRRTWCLSARDHPPRCRRTRHGHPSPRSDPLSRMVPLASPRPGVISAASGQRE
jgi:hypothetical protein